MNYDHTAIPADAVPTASVPLFQHLVDAYVSEVNKTDSVWSALEDGWLDWSPHPRSDTARKILRHQLLSERRFFAQFVGFDEPAPETLLPTNDAGGEAGVADYRERYVALAVARLPQIAGHDEAWWTSELPFFGQPRQRIWTFWRRVLHTVHHRAQICTYVRLCGGAVPSTYGPSGDVSWDGADPTNSVAAAGRGSA